MSSNQSYSDKQRNALHKWCRMCEKELNKKGLFRHGVIDYRKAFAWGEGDFKHYIYKPFLKVFLKKSSTESQDSKDPSIVCEALTAHFQTEYEVTLPEWPKSEIPIEVYEQ